MPYVEVLTTQKVKEEKRDELYHEFARIIELVPGKSESWVMVHLEDDAKMSFGGVSTEPSACINLKTFGELEDKYYDMLTDEICKSMSSFLEVDAKRVYVVYEPVTHWGWDRANF